ncbi:MAG: polyphosphate kinase 1 [Ignavibacteriaceae bacterium]|nr:polyphosphate kinase 1 [Ignavibacteriaceae bacterium]
MSKKILFDRELSWLSFNHRVLQEAKDPSVPLYERLKFLAIYSSNLDEFFRVRVASIRSLLNLKERSKAKLPFQPRILLKKIRDAVNKQQAEFGRIYNEEIFLKLKEENIFLVDKEKLNNAQAQFIKNYFLDQVVPFVQPTLLDKSKISTFLHNRAIYLAVRLKSKKKSKSTIKTRIQRFKYAIVEIPADRLGRFMTLPSENGKHFVIFLDDIIRMNLALLLPGYQIESCYSIKLTRDAELYIDDEFTGDLLAKIKKGLSKRKTGTPSRFLYDEQMPSDFLKFLKESLQLKNDDLIQGGKYHNFNDFFNFPKFNIHQLEYEPMPPQVCKELDGAVSIFEVISREDMLLSFPYQSYGYIIKFLEEAAYDVNVNSIKITLYRIADESLIVRSLVKAAENGKDVIAFVEVKARFDEETNFTSAETLLKAGVKVHSSFPGLKVHSKLCLIERIEKEKSQFYSYLATGNFNEKTARVYSDYGLFTANQELGKEVKKVFNILERKSDREKFKYLLVAPFNLRKKLIDLIDNEIINIKEDKTAGITLKLNSLEDRKMIKKLYEASQAGVKIKLIIRGICCLVPGIKELSENIEVISIIDRFLEHPRVYIFHNNGDSKYFLASADWMKRNLSRRIEVAFPVYDKTIQKLIQKMIDFQLNDNVKARVIDQDQKNDHKRNESEKNIRSQYEIYNLLK